MNPWDAVQVKDEKDPHHGIAGFVQSIDRANDAVVVKLDSDGSTATFKQEQLARLG